MSVIKRGKVFHLKIRPYGAQIMIATHAQTKTEAANIEAAILTALRAQDYRGLWPEAREVCLKLFRNQRWEIPPDLGGNPEPREELTLWRACELFLNYPTVKDHPSRWRYEIALSHVVEHFGKDARLKALWIPELKAYQMKRQNGGAAPDTINWELATLSRLFQVMVESQLVESNPVRLVARLSTKSGLRQSYLSRETVQAIATKCPEWFRFILWTAYYTGTRRGELLTLTRKQVNLGARIITLSPVDTKEEHWKRIPIHKELLPILEAVQQGPAFISGKVFPLYDTQGIRELGLGDLQELLAAGLRSIET
jgi:integrase